jgi:hypothetical protein
MRCEISPEFELMVKIRKLVQKDEIPEKMVKQITSPKKP